MKNRKEALLILVCGMSIAALTACGSSKAQSPAQSTEDLQQGTSAEQESTQQTVTESVQQTMTESAQQEQSLTGVVLDAAMHSMVIQTKDGQTLELKMAEDGINSDKLKDGILLGNGVTISYTGTIDGTDTSNATVTAAADLATKADDSDALSAAGSVILSLENQDYDTFVSMCSFPLYVGSGAGETINDEKTLREKYPMDKLFTTKLIEAVTHVDLLDLEKTEAGLVLSGAEGKPNVILSQVNDKWLITGIN